MIIKSIENCKGLFRNDLMEGVPIIFKKDNKLGIYDCFIKSKYTNLGFRLAYFLWNLKGSNLLSSLNYYSKHVNNLTDDNTTLRGAYGPRMRFWIGADQLQEAININTKIDDPEDFVKPKGVDQLQMCFHDLKNKMETSSIVMFDPSLDFENSNNIPDLISLIFKRDGETLHLMTNFSTANMNGEFINDYFFLSMLHVCMSKLLDLEPGFIYFSVMNPKFIETKIDFYEYNYRYCDELPSDFIIELFWENIFNLYEFEKHLRCAVFDESTKSEQVDLITHCNMLMEKFVSPIEDSFWQDYGKSLLICSLMKYSKTHDSYIEDILKTMSDGGFKREIMELINEKL